MKVLQDKSRKMAVLFNCQLSFDNSALLCGVTVFRGGMSGEIDLFGNGNEHFRIIIPEYVIENNTYIAKASYNDTLEIELAKNQIRNNR